MLPVFFVQILAPRCADESILAKQEIIFTLRYISLQASIQILRPQLITNHSELLL